MLRSKLFWNNPPRLTLKTFLLLSYDIMLLLACLLALLEQNVQWVALKEHSVFSKSDEHEYGNILFLVFVGVTFTSTLNPTLNLLVLTKQMWHKQSNHTPLTCYYKSLSSFNVTCAPYRKCNAIPDELLSKLTTS